MGQLKLFLLTLLFLPFVTNAYELYNKEYTKIEYKTEATKLTTKIKNRKIITFQEKKEWIRLLKRCGKVKLVNVTSANLIDKLNDNIVSCIAKL